MRGAKENQAYILTNLTAGQTRKHRSHESHDTLLRQLSPEVSQRAPHLRPSPKYYTHHLSLGNSTFPAHETVVVGCLSNKPARRSWPSLKARGRFPTYHRPHSGSPPSRQRLQRQSGSDRIPTTPNVHVGVHHNHRLGPLLPAPRFVYGAQSARRKLDEPVLCYCSIDSARTALSTIGAGNREGASIGVIRDCVPSDS
eukprot:25077_6